MSSKFSNSKPGYPFSTYHGKNINAFLIKMYGVPIVETNPDFVNNDELFAQPGHEFYPTDQLGCQSYVWVHCANVGGLRYGVYLREIAKLLKQKDYNQELITWEEFQNFLVMQKLAE